MGMGRKDNLEIRRLRDEELVDSLQLSMYAFQYTVPENEIANRVEQAKHHQVFGIWEEEKLASKLHIIPLKVNIQGKAVEMGGIAGVASYPEYRRNGYVKHLLSHALKEMKECGQIISLLHPFDIHFYRKYGWEIFTDKKEIVIEQKDLKMIGKVTGQIKRYDKESHNETIEKIYHEYCSRFEGMLVRSHEWWEKQIYHGEKIAVFYDEKKLGRGYILYRVKDKEMMVEELVALDHEARVNLWNFICQHDSMVEKVKIHTSIHEPFPFFTYQPKLKTEIYPYFMARIVDVEAFLTNYSFIASDSKVFIHIQDEYAPWNNGTYLLTNEGVKVFKEKQGSSCAHPPERGVTMDIRSLTAILLGYKRPSQLYEMELLKGKGAEVSELEKRIPILKPFIYDFF